MPTSRSLIFASSLILVVFASTQTSYAGVGPEDAMRTCKNSASERLPGVPLAFINVNRGSDTNDGGYTIHFTSQPPNGPRSSGFCIISRNGRVQNLQFNPNPPPGNNRGGGVSPQDAMRTCKNTASGRLPGVPLAYISVDRGSDTGDGSYMINFHSQPPNGRNASGFCRITQNGRVQQFQFDPDQGVVNTTGAGSIGMSPQDAMRACKNEVGARRPNIPLAYITVDQASQNGGSLMVNFRAQPPRGPRASGSCDVFKNGKVNVQFDRQ
jgi:uncharacterized protein (UPF0212 family)